MESSAQEEHTPSSNEDLMEGASSAEDNEAVKEAVSCCPNWCGWCKNTGARSVKFCVKVCVGGIAKNADGKNQTSDGGC